MYQDTVVLEMLCWKRFTENTWNASQSTSNIRNIAPLNQYFFQQYILS